jgi:anti-sigma regulatory factor (Ser/Thr protein kinase)
MTERFINDVCLLLYMVPITIDDLFDLEDPNTIVRKSFSGSIKLRDVGGADLHIPDGYKEKVIDVSNKDCVDFHSEMTEICSGAGDRTRQFTAAVYEAFRNAHEHGHNRQPGKAITFNYGLDKDKYFSVIVSDQGGVLNANFAPFVLLHRQGLQGPLSFYSFAPSAIQQSGNSGIGTFVLHQGSDEVSYHKNSNDGLSVWLRTKTE